MRKQRPKLCLTANPLKYIYLPTLLLPLAALLSFSPVNLLLHLIIPFFYIDQMNRPRPLTIPYSSTLMDTETGYLSSEVPETVKSLSSQFSENQFNPSQSGSKSSFQQPRHTASQEDITKHDFLNYADTLLKLQNKHQNLASRKSSGGNGRKKCENKHLDEKIKRICSNFISKIKRNNIFSSVAITDTDLQRFYKREYLQGFEVNQYLVLVHKIVFVFSIISLAISQSFVFAFEELKSSAVIRGILSFSALAFLSQLVMNLTVVKRVQGNYISNLKDIIMHYMKSGHLFIDSIIFIIITINLFVPDSTWNLILIFALLFEVQETAIKLSTLEQYIVKNYYYEKYISLLKIMLFNFIYAHAIAVLLNQVAINNAEHSWQTLKGIDRRGWSERYIWSYYWATTIMLTVGFGDIVPTNSNEALCVVFIEFASCIAFSYNISCLGTLISNIKSQNEETEKNRKIFEGMDKKVKFSESLFSKIEHFINESAYIRSKFNISQEKTFIENLPAGYRNEVTCQTNKKLLKPLPFFSCLLDKTIYKIAKHMERHIYYPEETIKTISSNFSIYVLENGKIGYICKKFGSKYNNVVANEVKVQNNSKPFILAQQFITLKKLNYEIKSLGYSVIHKLGYEFFLEEIKKMKKDYEYFTFLRDKSKHIIDQYETVQCSICLAKHTSFDCPKYHYMPIHQHVHLKYLQKEKLNRNERYTLYQRKDRKYHALSSVKKDEFGSKDFVKSETERNMRLRLTDKQEQMKRFVVNFYDFYEKPLAMKKISQSFHDECTFKTMLNIGNAFDINDDQSSLLQTDFWQLQLDTGFDYDIYFPSDNPMHLVRKYNFERRIVKVLKRSREDEVMLRIQ